MKTITTLLFLTASVAAHAQTPRHDLSRFQCYKVDEKGLHMTAADAFAGRGFPKAYAAPSAFSKVIGSTSEIVYVAWPLIKQNGYLQILRINGQIGWVAEKTLIPMHTAQGKVGGCTLNYGENGNIMTKLDPGIAVRY